MSVHSYILLSRFRSAQSVLAVVGVDAVAPNVFALDYKVLAGVAASGAVLSLVKALGKLGVQTARSTNDGSSGGGDLSGV